MAASESVRQRIRATNAQNDVPKVRVAKLAELEKTDEDTEQIHVKHLPLTGTGHHAAQGDGERQAATAVQRQQQVQQAAHQQGGGDEHEDRHRDREGGVAHVDQPETL